LVVLRLLYGATIFFAADLARNTVRGKHLHSLGLTFLMRKEKNKKKSFKRNKKDAPPMLMAQFFKIVKYY